MIKNILQIIGSFSGRDQNLGERLLADECEKRMQGAMNVAFVLGSIANRDLEYDRLEAQETLLSFKEVLHENDLVVQRWPEDWVSLQTYFGDRNIEIHQ